MSRYSPTNWILVLLIFSLFSCSEYEEVEFKNIRNLRVTGMSGGKLSIEGEAVFYNPNSKGIRLKKGLIEVYQGEKLVAEIKPSKKVKIKSKDNFEIPVNIELNLKDSGLLRNVIGLLGKKEIELDFKGHITFSTWLIPSRIEINETQKVRF